MLKGRLIIVHGDTDLPQVVPATVFAGGFTSGLDRRQQQSEKCSDNGDHHQEFNQGKTV
jgi:hypothetical protein